jgi:P4 family phage/plasmid primase-like protien
LEYKPINPTTIAQLKQKHIWLCWVKTADKNGRITKKPVAASGVATGTTRRYRKTWVTYDEAIAAAKERRFDGVGFVIPKGFFFLDIDGKTPDDPFVRDLMQLLPSYCEISVSGNGTHIYGCCDLSRLPAVRDEQGRFRLDPRYYTKNPNNSVEIYIGGLTNRYAVFTGNTAADLPLADCTEGIQAVLDSYMLNQAALSQQTLSSVPGISAEPEPELDPEALDLMALDVIDDLRHQKNAPKFSRLFDEGEITGYKSQSEADLALASIVAFRAGDNPQLIEAVMRRSALCREKWDVHPTYLSGTIQKAISSHSGIFDPASGEIPPFVVLTGRKHDIPTLSAPRLAEYFRRNYFYLLVRTRANQTTQLFIYEHGVYTLYDRNMTIGLLKEPVVRYDIDLANMGKIEEAYKHIMSDRDVISYEALNREESVINFRNGLLRVSADSLTLEPHSPDVCSTIQLPCDWIDHDEPTPVFDAYLDTLADGNEKLKQLFLQYIGVTISNVKGYRMKKILIMVGPGDTGKSQLKALTERILGPGNFLSADLKEIEARFGTGNVFGKRLVGCSDMSFARVDELKVLKMFSGGDSVFAEYKGQQGFEFTFDGQLWFCANEPPKFGGDHGKWTYERIMLVHCPNVIPAEMQDKQLLDKMYAERSGIVRKCVKALQQVLANGYRYDEPLCVVEAREDYQRDNSTVIGFLAECMCDRQPGDYKDGLTTSKVYDVYRAWCDKNNHGYARSFKEFKKELAAYLNVDGSLMVDRCEKGSVFRYLTLTKEAVDEFHSALGYDFDMEKAS